jgi:hypothetical protein
MVLQAVGEPFMSEHIDKGSRSIASIAQALEGTKVGIVCLTPENLLAPWVLYESGALTKTVDDDTRLCTYLIGGLKPHEVEQPLGMFQATRAEREETRKLVHAINRAVHEEPLPEKLINGLFDLAWPQLEARLESLPSPEKVVEPKRAPEEMLAEILDTVRGGRDRELAEAQQRVAQERDVMRKLQAELDSRTKELAVTVQARERDLTDMRMSLEHERMKLEEDRAKLNQKRLELEQVHQSEPQAAHQKNPSNVAIHESAHAIMFDALGEKLELVTVIPCVAAGHDLEGCTVLAGDESAWRSPLAGIPGALAGPAASIYIAGESLERFTDGDFHTDEKLLISMFDQQGNGGDFEDYKSKIHRSLNEWVRPWILDHREVIMSFAEHLEKAHSLKGESLTHAISVAWSGRQRPSADDLKANFEKFWQGIDSPEPN